MHLPKQFAESDITVLHALIRAAPLGAWVTEADGELEVNHIPFLLDAERGKFGVIAGHVAKANPVWKSFSQDMASVVIFQGPQTYITPSWYPSKAAHGKVVPTWNYAVVHAYGQPQAIHDPAWLLHHVSQQVDLREKDQAHPWKVADAPPDYIDKMVGAIVGIEISIARLLGKWKVSQNRSQPDKLGTVAGLLNRNDDNANAMAALVKTHVNV
ncbi:MAG: FMN-binding negative transcriptional regulator [Gammaproteobacteria bacterium]|nr:FMN-binding negative transcriptional regulator [Gammaproteobacteria bacterium]